MSTIHSQVTFNTRGGEADEVLRMGFWTLGDRSCAVNNLCSSLCLKQFLQLPTFSSVFSLRCIPTDLSLPTSSTGFLLWIIVSNFSFPSFCLMVSVQSTKTEDLGFMASTLLCWFSLDVVLTLGRGGECLWVFDFELTTTMLDPRGFRRGNWLSILCFDIAFRWVTFCRIQLIFPLSTFSSWLYVSINHMIDNSVWVYNIIWCLNEQVTQGASSYAIWLRRSKKHRSLLSKIIEKIKECGSSNTLTPCGLVPPGSKRYYDTALSESNEELSLLFTRLQPARNSCGAC